MFVFIDAFVYRPICVCVFALSVCIDTVVCMCAYLLRLHVLTRLCVYLLCLYVFTRLCVCVRICFVCMFAVCKRSSIDNLIST